MDPLNSGASNPLDEKKKYEGAATPENEKKPGDVEQIYTEDDRKYISFLQRRLEDAKTVRNNPLEDLGGKTYIQIYEENEKIANTNLPAKKNEDDVIVSAGTIEAKLDALLSHISNLDLSPEVHAFDRENNKLQEIGVALQDVIYMTEEKDGADEGGDEEKKLLRQRELLKQGTVFVQEEWLRLWETKKKLKKDFDGKFKQDAEFYSEALELVFDGPSRTVLHGPNVYLGNITEFYMEKQPYVFAVIHMSHDVAKAKYGRFENFDKYVKAGNYVDKTEGTSTVAGKTIFDNKWRLTEVKKDNVEVIIYQDKPRDEFQILINGVLMLPIGFPLSAVTPGGNYNIAKQVFRVINSHFAYGKSFVSSGAVKEVSALIDEMLKLFVLKTRKSYAPPYINTSGKVISKRVLSAGRISMGIPPDALVPIGQEGQGVTANEYSILKELSDRVDKSTISAQFQGQSGKSGQTATETVELQRQAKLTLGLAIAACSFLEKKLGYLRLWNILENWFEPIDTKLVLIDNERREMNRYRNSFRETNIEGEGFGARQVITVDGMVPAPETIRELERRESEKYGFPIRKVYLSYNGLKSARLKWYITVTPREKETSALNKLTFREDLNDVLALMQMGSIPNVGGLEEEFATSRGKKRQKYFATATAMGPSNLAGVSPSSIRGQLNGSGGGSSLSVNTTVPSS